MIGAVAGDVIGSVHEFLGTKTRDFELFYGGVPPDIAARAMSLLDDRLRDVTLTFCARYQC